MTNLAVLLASAAFLVASVLGDLKNALVALILIALSYPIYRVLALGKRPPAGANDASAAPLE